MIPSLGGDRVSDVKYQAEVYVMEAWHPVGPAMRHRLLVEANVDGYKDQAATQGRVVEFRIVEVTR